MAQGGGRPGADASLNPANYEQIDAPLISASAVALQSAGNAFLLIFQRPRPVMDKRAHALAEVNFNETVGIVSVSPHTLKDMLLLLGDALANYERDYGELVTPYVKRRAAERGQS